MANFVRRMKRDLIYIYFNARITFRSNTIYRAATVVQFFSQGILLVAMAALWKAMYQSDSSFGGHDFNYMMGYWILSISLSQIYPLGVSGALSQNVKSGAVVFALLKPIPIELQFFSQALGGSLYNLLFVSLPLFLVGTLLYQVQFYLAFHQMLLALAFFVSVYFFVFSLEIAIGCLSYFTQSLWGIRTLKSSVVSFLSGKLFPIVLYPMVLRSVLQYLPFAAMYYIPINLMMEKFTGRVSVYFIITLSSAFFLFLFYFIISKLTMRRIMIQGG